MSSRAGEMMKDDLSCGPVKPPKSRRPRRRSWRSPQLADAGTTMLGGGGGEAGDERRAEPGRDRRPAARRDSGVDTARMRDPPSPATTSARRPASCGRMPTLEMINERFRA
jgi:hypothetical protein